MWTKQQYPKISISKYLVSQKGWIKKNSRIALYEVEILEQDKWRWEGARMEEISKDGEEEERKGLREI